MNRRDAAALRAAVDAARQAMENEGADYAYAFGYLAGTVEALCEAAPRRTKAATR